MKKMLNAVLPNLCISLALAVATIVLVDYINPFLGFLTSNAARIIIYIFCGVSIVISINLYVQWRNNTKQ